MNSQDALRQAKLALFTRKARWWSSHLNFCTTLSFIALIMQLDVSTLVCSLVESTFILQKLLENVITVTSNVAMPKFKEMMP